MEIKKQEWGYELTLSDGTYVAAHEENPSPLVRGLYAALEKLDEINSMVQDELDNQCPECEKGRLIEYSSRNEKVCESCDHTRPWNLKPGQPSKY